MKREFKKNDKVYITAGATFVYRDKDACVDKMSIVGCYSEFKWEVVQSDTWTSVLKRFSSTCADTITIEIANKDILTSYP